MQNDFYRVFSAYREGILRKKPPAVDESDGNQEASLVQRKLDFEQLASCACLGLSSPGERLASRVVAWTARLGFMAAHAGELVLAREHFTESWKQWRELDEGLCRIRLVGIIEAYEAYLEYRLGCRSEARDRLERALDSALLLEERYGLSLYELHRMQLGHNLVRVDWRFGFLEEAFSLAGALVGYLEGRRRDLPFHRGWCNKRLLSCPIYLRKLMVAQIAGEAIDHLISHPESSYWDIFFGEARIGDETTNDLFSVDLRLWQWHQARRILLQGDDRGYLQILREILLPGPRGLGTLYYAIIVDFAEFCAADRSLPARKVLDLLLQDSLKWKNFPVILAKRLSEICHASSATG